jgi:choline dehydrogenase-like flavoprotein
MTSVVIGAGVSGAHAALTLLERGRSVELWDIGREEAPFPPAGQSFQDLKRSLSDPFDYFLGGDSSGIVPPGRGELLRYPPSRNFLAPHDDPLWGFDCDGFEPFLSFHRGGLANGWGANALAFDDDDIADWPISRQDLAQDYRTVCARIAIAGPEQDELSQHFPDLEVSQAPLALTRADHRLLGRYKRAKGTLARRGLRIGRARMAVITDPDSPNGCDYCERCLWGCPRGSIYNPARTTLAECDAHRGFTYRPGRAVLSLTAEDERITGIRYLDVDTGRVQEAACDEVFLAAGALASGGIFLRTLREAAPDLPARTEGLLDTRVAKVLFVLLANLGARPEPRAFQFNRLILGLLSPDRGEWPRYLHGEILPLPSLLYHPLIEWLPFDTRLNKRLFFALRSTLATASLFFPDKPDPARYLSLTDDGGPWPMARLTSRESAAQTAFIDAVVKRLEGLLWRLACVPAGRVLSPLGAGIHYAGTIPMGSGPRRCDSTGRANRFRNLWIADGAAFPSLPSKSITLSLAAHATRVARLAGL